MKSLASGQICRSVKIRFALLLIITIMVSLINTGHLLAANPGESKYKTISGTVKKAGDSLIAIKTKVGTTRYITRKHVEKRGMSALASGDRVLLVLDAGNLIVDIHSRGLSSVRGTIETLRASEKSATVRLQNGRVRDYELKDKVLPKLNHIRKGTLITFEIDKQDRIMDVRVN